LRRLESDGLIVVEQSPDDGRARIAQLSRAGRIEWKLLDRRSDELAWSLLEPLDDEQRTRLVEAMGVVERLLTSGLVEITIDEPTSAAVRHCFESYFAELDARFEAGFDPGRSISAEADELAEPRGLVLVARLHDEAIGCGALKLHGGDPAEIKRMWVHPAWRGAGLGSRLLRHLEAVAVELGYETVRLDTNGTLTNAIALYERAGYRHIARYNDNPYAQVWLEKNLIIQPA